MRWLCWASICRWTTRKNPANKRWVKSRACSKGVTSRLFDNPDCENQEMSLAQRCLRHLAIAAFLSNQELFPLIVGTSVGISLEHGNAPKSALSFANYGLMLGAFMGKYKEGFEFGDLALRLCDQFGGSAPTATVLLGPRR